MSGHLLRSADLCVYVRSGGHDARQIVDEQLSAVFNGAGFARSSSMLRVLDIGSEAHLAHARELLANLRQALTQFGASTGDQAALETSIRQLDQLFMLVIVGEFNSGKSAFINALLGQPLLEEGVTPTTGEIQALKFGDTVTRGTGPDGLRVVTAPVELLRDVDVVDTPGTNAILREHERLTTDFVPRSDLVVFITAADRPFTETERLFLATIRDWGKKIVIVLNKVDIFSKTSELEEVLTFVKKAARELLGLTPSVLPVSARLAQRAKHGEPSLWAPSRFEALEQYLRDTLDAGNRFRLKLANPLGVGLALGTRYTTIAAERLTLMEEDLQLLADIERQLAVYREDLERGFELRMAAAEKELADMESRGHRFFDDTLRIGRVVDLLNRARMQKEFEEKVVADAPIQVERRVSEMIDWLVDQDFRQWQAVTSKLLARHRQHESRMLGAPDVGSFHNDRSKLIDLVGREAQRVVDTYDKRREAELIADQARVAVAAAAAAGGAAVGLGTIVAVAASTVAADVTGLLLASLVLGVGFLIIPARRKRAKATLEEKVAALRVRLAATLRSEFNRAREQSGHRLGDAVAPYARFVHAEERRWSEARHSLTRLREETSALLTELKADEQH
jgi:GTP-binding protein EngB required for normal cell division